MIVHPVPDFLLIENPGALGGLESCDEAIPGKFIILAKNLRQCSALSPVRDLNLRNNHHCYRLPALGRVYELLDVDRHLVSEMKHQTPGRGKRYHHVQQVSQFRIAPTNLV